MGLFFLFLVLCFLTHPKSVIVWCCHCRCQRRADVCANRWVFRGWGMLYPFRHRRPSFVCQNAFNSTYSAGVKVVAVTSLALTWSRRRLFFWFFCCLLSSCLFFPKHLNDSLRMFPVNFLNVLFFFSFGVKELNNFQFDVDFLNS